MNLCGRRFRRDRGRSRRRAETPVAVDHRLSVVGRTGDAGLIAAVLPAPPCHDRRRPTRGWIRPVARKRPETVKKRCLLRSFWCAM